ncbi:MAG: hypothetical protein ACXV2H_05815 [Actinomycetes bacterium]
MTDSRRLAGFGLLTFALGTFTALTLANAPGGDYEAAQVADYVSSGRRVTELATGYLGLLAALGLAVFVTRVRPMVESASSRAIGDLFGTLGVGAATVAAVGWTVTAGIPVAFAEGGDRIVVAAPTVYVLSEIGVLLNLATPAILMGVAIIVLAVRAGALVPSWLRVATVVAGVCGVAAPFFFPYFVFLLWAVVTGVWCVAGGRTAPVITPQGSLA